MKNTIMNKSKRVYSLRGNKSNTNKKKPLIKPSAIEKKQEKVSKLKAPLQENSLENPDLLKATFPNPSAKTSFSFVAALKKNTLVSKEQIQSGVRALFQYLEKTTNTDVALFDDEKPIFLQITSIKVPKTPTRIFRFSIPNALLTESSEICLIVKDIGKPKEHEETIEHYEQLLSKHGITNIKTILPYHQFRTEYGNQFELKRNLLNLYDYFLVDSTVSGYVTKLLGNIFKNKRKTPAPIKMYVPHLKTQIERALKKTYLKLHSQSDSFIVQVGHNKMNQTDISENILEVIDQLCDEFPGGGDNIRALGIKSDRGLSVPIYLTLKNKNAVPVPVVRSKRPKRFEPISGELSTLLNKEVTVLPSGKVFVRTVEGSDDEEEQDEEELEAE